MDKVKCKCGHELLLVPDVKAMSEAIESHVSEHKCKENLTEVEANAIRVDLIVKVFKLSADL